MTPEESELLAVVGRELWRKALGRGVLGQRMMDPQPGDLVMEITRWGSFDPDGIGRLARVEGSAPGERWVVKPLHRPGEEQGWQNAQFIALPDRRKWAEG